MQEITLLKKVIENMESDNKTLLLDALDKIENIDTESIEVWNHCDYCHSILNENRECPINCLNQSIKPMYSYVLYNQNKKGDISSIYINSDIDILKEAYRHRTQDKEYISKRDIEVKISYCRLEIFDIDNLKPKE